MDTSLFTHLPARSDLSLGFLDPEFFLQVITWVKSRENER